MPARGGKRRQTRSPPRLKIELPGVAIYAAVDGNVGAPSDRLTLGALVVPHVLVPVLSGPIGNISPSLTQARRVIGAPCSLSLVSTPRGFPKARAQTSGEARVTRSSSPEPRRAGRRGFPRASPGCILPGMTGGIRKVEGTERPEPLPLEAKRRHWPCSPDAFPQA